MITANQYYNLLYEKLFLSHKTEFDLCLKKENSGMIPQPIGNRYETLKRLLDIVEQKYGFNMKLNYVQLTLWQQAFCKEDEYSLKEDAFYASGSFVLFCCLVDNFLDSPRFTEREKEIICKKIECFEMNDSKDNLFPELDILFGDFWRFLNSCQEDTKCKKTYLIDLVKRAFQSEIYMYRSVLQKDTVMNITELNSLIDKSIAFEKAALLVASYGTNSDSSLKAAEIMGNIFWLIDDLCDFVVDIQENRKNSLLVYCISTDNNHPLEECINLVYENLEKPIQHLYDNLMLLRDIAGEDLYVFMMNQVWKWSYHVCEMVGIAKK